MVSSADHCAEHAIVASFDLITIDRSVN